MFAELLIEDEESPKIALLQSCIEELTAKVQEQTQIGDALNQLTNQQGQEAGQQPQPKEPLQAGALAGQQY